MFRVNRGVVAPVLAEFFGTGILVMVALILGQTTAVSYFIATSLAVTAAAVYLLFSVVSGAHFLIPTRQSRSACGRHAGSVHCAVSATSPPSF
jgi:hypothetical protein